MSQRTSLRTRETQNSFDTYKRSRDPTSDSCPLCGAVTEQLFEHWRIIPNDYPYDAIAEKHSMLIPKRHIATLGALSDEERSEFHAIEPEITGFDSVLRNFLSNQTVPDHYHIHLLKYKTISE